MVDVGAEPVVVGDVIVGARGNEEALEVRAVLGEWASVVVAIEREATLQPAAELGEARDPAAVRGEVVAVVQAIAARQALEREVSERGARLPDGEARMGAALEQHDVVSLNSEDPREQRSSKAAADDCYMHWEQVTAGSRLPVRLSRLRRATRGARQAPQAGPRSATPRTGGGPTRG